MPANPNWLSQFWQELKRRNVTHVLAVYIAVGFMLLELVDIISEPFGLPDWSLKLTLFILIAGLFITVIISWIFDVSSKGVEKTKPSGELKEGEKTVVSNSWKIASYISFVVIVALIILNILPRNKGTDGSEIVDKSIAILPFIDDSPDKSNEHIINGIMQDLLINLQSIGELRVPGRTSVEQYRNNPKVIPEIADDLGVAYIVEGTGQRYGNKLRLRVQLIDGTIDKHLWADSYDAEITKPEDIFRIQSKIARAIAAELEAAITPEEQKIIEKIPTGNLTAYEFFLRGREEYIKLGGDQRILGEANKNLEALEKVEDLFNKTLEYDSTFAQAYTGLGWVYKNRNFWKTYLKDDFLDSMIILADIALSYDNQLAEAYVLRGDYYRYHSNKEQAIKEYDRAIKLNPNDWQAYWYIGRMYEHDDYVKTIDNFNKAATLHRGSYLPEIFRALGFAYGEAGFKEADIYYVKEALKLDDDSARYYRSRAAIEESDRNFDQAIEFGIKSLSIDSTDWWVSYRLGMVHSYIGRYEEYLEYVRKYESSFETFDRTNPQCIFVLGHAYWVNGYEEEAEYYLNTGLEYYTELVELGRHFAQNYFIYRSLAAMYAFLGDKDKAYENLRLFNQSRRMPYYMIKDIKNDPLFNSIRGEPEFQQIVRDVEAKHQAEHERVSKWLEENDML